MATDSALHKHFSEASTDPKRNSTESCMFTGLANRLSSVTFVHNLAVMYDALAIRVIIVTSGQKHVSLDRSVC